MGYVRYFDFNQYDQRLDFPFNVKFCFKKIFEFWEAQAESEDLETAAEAKALLARLASRPALREPFNDLSVVEENEKTITFFNYHISWFYIYRKIVLSTSLYK